MSKFHFVLKTPKSASLSHSDENEQYNIRSHAQTRRRAASRSPVPKAAPTARGLPHRLGADGTLTFQSRSTSSLIDLDRGASETSPGAATRTSVWHHGFRHVVTTEHGWNPLSFLSRNTFDPFNSTILEQDSTTFQVFQFATSDFSNVNFRAESLCLVPSSADEYRHTEAISQRTQLALGNEMVMSTTLAYASAAMGWRFGIRYQQRPPEYFIQQAYTAIRCRLFQSMDVDNVLVMCIYSLAASEMWVKNYTAARTHLRMLGQMIQSMGGIAKLEPYVMDSVILGTKYDLTSSAYMPRGVLLIILSGSSLFSQIRYRFYPWIGNLTIDDQKQHKKPRLMSCLLQQTQESDILLPTIQQQSESPSR